MSWLNPSLWDSVCKFQVATTEKRFHAILRDLGLQEDLWPMFQKNARADATTHFFESDKDHCAIVCLPRQVKDISGIQIASLLVHEAVHIWQHHRDLVGEANPGTESEAYAIQAIAQRLMYEYWRQVK